MRAHRQELLPFCETRRFSEMVRELAELGTYGDHTSLVALARIYRVNVVVHRLAEIPRLVARGLNEDDGIDLPQVHLAFHDDMEHYSSVRLLRGPTNGPALVQTDLTALEKLAKPTRWLHLRRLRHRDGKLAYKMQLAELR